MTLVIDPPPTRPGAGTDRPVSPGTIVVALVNNMPDAALEGTEVQFRTLLEAASERHDVRLRFAALPEVARGADARARIASRYWSVDELVSAPIDGLIVTGTEPRAQSLPDEPYWARMVDLLAFAEEATISSIWSCLAAHVAVLALDGVERRRLPDKRFGVFGHRVAAGHVLTDGLGAPHAVPHSRWNDLSPSELTDAGYVVLTESEETGADAFVKVRRNMLVFLQGHPEYEERTLLKEFQRDVQRFLASEQPRFPGLPAGYFGAEATARLMSFQSDVAAGRLADPVAAFPFTAVAATLSSHWRAPAARLYSNWLGFIADRRWGDAGNSAGQPAMMAVTAGES